MRDLYNKIAPVMLLAPVDIATSDTLSSILDLQGFQGAEIDVLVGVITTPDSTSYVTPVLEESDTTVTGDFTTVAAGDIIGDGFTKMDAATEDAVLQRAGYKGSKRYLRAKLDITDADGGISAGLFGVIGILGGANEQPATAPAAVAAT